MEELLKTIRNSHYLLLLSCVALILLSYSSYLTRIYQNASDEITAFEKMSIQRYLDSKGWDLPVGGQMTSIGGMITHSMPKLMQELTQGNTGEFLDNKQMFSKYDDDYKKIVSDAVQRAGSNFAEGFDFSKQHFLPFSSDPRVSIHITDTTTLQELYDALNSDAAKRPLVLFTPDKDRLIQALDVILKNFNGATPPLGALYFDEVKSGIDVKANKSAPMGILAACSPEAVPPQEPRQCSVAEAKKNRKGTIAIQSVVGSSVPVIGTSLEDWIANQDNSVQFAIHTGNAANKLEYFPNLRLIWSEVRFMTIDKAKAYLSDRRATYTQELPIEGLKASGQSALVFGPLLLLSLLILLRSHLRHLSSASEALPEFPWIGLYNGPIDRLFTAASIALLPVVACVLEALFFTYFTTLLWICAVCTPILLYLGVSSVRDLTGIRKRRDVSDRKVTRTRDRRRRPS